MPEQRDRFVRRVRTAAWLAACLASGALFFTRLPELWPLARIDASMSREQLVPPARELLRRNGFPLATFRAATWFRVDTSALDYVEDAFGFGRSQEWIARGVPLYEHRVLFKRRGDPTVILVAWHPTRGALGWTAYLEEDEPGESIGIDQARELAWTTASRELGIERSDWTERSAASERRPARVDHEFVFERFLSERPELRERLNLLVAGDRVASARLSLVVPAAAARAARSAEAPAVGLETVGFGLLAVAATGAFVVFLRRLQDRSVRLARAVVWPVAVALCFTAAAALDTASLFRAWDPMWPIALSVGRELVLGGATQVWVLLVLLAVIAAGDALDRASGARRGESLWSFARGRLLDRSVALASGRGFLVGLLCGGTIAGAVWLLQSVANGRVSIQPRGFFFYPLNSAAPSLTTLVFFAGVALAEELGYRFFGATWLLRLFRRPWIAVVVPAVVYGLTHTRLDFLPPAEPFWGRPLVLTLVGCVWGWAFLRYDALTVVLSHLTADLFIFNWPVWASGGTGTRAVAAATFCVPLVPALLYVLFGRRPDPASAPSP